MISKSVGFAARIRQIGTIYGNIKKSLASFCAGMSALLPEALLAGSSPLQSSLAAQQKWCIATIDVPGSPTAQGTASAFSKLALLMNATIFGMQDVLLPKYDCPDEVKCVTTDTLLTSLRSGGCDVTITHEWRSPMHAMGTPEAEDFVRIVNVHGGLKFSQSWRNSGNLHKWARFYTEDANEIAAFHVADHVVYPSMWMYNWTCINQVHDLLPIPHHHTPLQARAAHTRPIRSTRPSTHPPPPSASLHRLVPRASATLRVHRCSRTS